MSTRLSVNVNDETARVLRELADRRETSVTEVVRRCVAVFKLLDDEQQAGKTIRLVDKHETTNVVLL